MMTKKTYQQPACDVMELKPEEKVMLGDASPGGFPGIGAKEHSDKLDIWEEDETEEQ